MIVDQPTNADSRRGLHNRLRASAIWIGVLGAVVSIVAYTALYLLGDAPALLTLEVTVFVLIFTTISICSYRDLYVRRVLFGGLVSIYFLFWLSAFTFSLQGESILLALPLVLFVPLLIVMALPYKLLFALAPLQFLAMFFYTVEFAFPRMGVAWSEGEQLIVSVGLASFSSVVLMAFAVLAIARADGDAKLMKLISDKERIASIDPLTELLNRRAFMNQLEAHWPPTDALAIAFIDLDHFKPLNDQYGHAMGDFVLRQVAKRLETVPWAVAVARLGGDEFAICCSVAGSGAGEAGEKAADERGLGSPQTAAAEMHSRIAADFQSDIGPISMGASIGYAVYDGDTDSLSMLLRAADTAMRRAKSTRSGWATFSHATDGAALTSSSIEFELKSALRNGNIRAALQPIARVADLEVIEYELLARWVNSGFERDPGPAQFIPIAEKQGLLNDILWVTLDEALSELDLGRRTLAVNVSPAQLSATDFLANLLDILERHSIDPRAITLEITEEVALRNLERNVAVLDHAKSVGMTIALDDFGSGYSSLSMLDALPLDKLKIDQDLIKKAEQNPRSANILNAAIKLAQQLDLIACVEGVETQQGLDKVIRMGADQVQGYLIGKPQMLRDESNSDQPECV